MDVSARSFAPRGIRDRFCAGGVCVCAVCMAGKERAKCDYVFSRLGLPCRAGRF